MKREESALDLALLGNTPQSDEGSLPTLSFDSGEMQRGNRGETEKSKNNNSKRRFSIAEALVQVVAVIRGRGLWWHRNAAQEHDWAFPPNRSAVKIYKVQEDEYRDYLAPDDVKSASAVTDERVSDAKTVQAMTESA